MRRNLLILFFLVVFSLSFLAGKTYAADAFPPPGRIPCDLSSSENPEFNSDRPYQGSPCGDRPITYWCGNKVVIDLGSVSCKPPFIGAESCQYTGPPITKNIDVDLTDVQLPILGNTQLVQNSQNGTETLDDAAKVNDYVAWYLGGVNYRAEYGDSKNTDAQTVNFSGPVQKLLPEAIQNADRITSILAVTKKAPDFTDDETGQTVSSDNQNHNQIVVCIQNGKPTDCYQGNNTQAQGQVYRLNDWNTGGLSLLTTFFNWAGTSIWNNRYPPLPWQFSKDVYYQKAYNEWRGQTCAIIPITNTLICATLPLISNPTSWSSLFAYVPLANTTDKKGIHMVTSVILRAPKAEITSSTYDVLHSPQLYLAHTLENSTLSDILKSTFKPGDKTLPGGGVGVTGTTIPKDVEDNSSACRIITSRSNPGDDATFTNPESHIQVTTTYTVGAIECDPPEWVCSGSTKRDNVNCRWVQQCRSEVYATVPSISKTPYGDEIFNNTVAGSDSIFRRIYPKTGPDAPVSCIADTPAVSPATYTLNQGGSSPGLSLIRVIEPDGSSINSGNPTGGNSINAQLFYPHFGSVLDYFLNGIQTALRPQGYGNPTPQNGTQCLKTSSSSLTDICAVADAYHIPCCQLKGIAELETGGGSNVGKGSCSTKNGNFQCCNGNVCGPSQIVCSQYNAFAGNDKIDICDPAGSAELLARAMLLKLCQAAGKCDSYDWTTMKTKALQFKVPAGNYTAAAYFYGLANGCTVNACTEYRWGPGKTYCDSVKAYCDTGKILPDNTSPQFCAACNQDLIRAGQTPINCSP